MGKSIRKLKYFFAKVGRFEFWPFYIFYVPMYFYGIYLAIRSRSPMYFSTVNPCMKFGGAFGISKYNILKIIPQQFVPNTILVPSKANVPDVIKLMGDNGLAWPIIIKPNIGERGKKVEKVKGEDELEGYLDMSNEPLIIQEYIDYPIELGIFYYRMPNEQVGHITSVALKKFLTVTGNGKSTLQELLSNEIRAGHRLGYFKSKFGPIWGQILPLGQTVQLEPIGNHNRGTAFLNANHLINDKLVQVVHSIAKQIDNFYYGRFDIRVSSIEDLYEGKNIKILELNGVASEPAHIYDPSAKLLSAYKSVFHHMYIIYKISKMNFELGTMRDNLSGFIKELARHSRRNKERKQLALKVWS